MRFWRIGIYTALGLAGLALIGFVTALASLNLKLFAASAVLGLLAVGVLVAAILNRSKGQAGTEH